MRLRDPARRSLRPSCSGSAKSTRTGLTTLKSTPPCRARNGAPKLSGDDSTKDPRPRRSVDSRAPRQSLAAKSWTAPACCRQKLRAGWPRARSPRPRARRWWPRACRACLVSPASNDVPSHFVLPRGAACTLRWDPHVRATTRSIGGTRSAPSAHRSRTRYPESVRADPGQFSGFGAMTVTVNPERSRTAVDVSPSRSYPRVSVSL
jgi:hypothetical protein